MLTFVYIVAFFVAIVAWFAALLPASFLTSPRTFFSVPFGGESCVNGYLYLTDSYPRYSIDEDLN